MGDRDIMTVDNVKNRERNMARTGIIEPISPNDHKAARRRAIAISVSACLLLLMIPFVLLAASMLGAFGPRDVGGSYEREDLEAIYAKIGLAYTAADGTELHGLVDLVEYEAKSTWNGNMSYSDFIWTYDDYGPVDLELTAAELQALICEASPMAFWTDQLQINVLDNSRVEISALLEFDRVLTELFPLERSELPVSGFRQINFYLLARPNIYENQLELNTDEIRIGPLQVVENKVLDQNAVYLERIYRTVPGLTIHSLEVTNHKTIRISMTIPRRVSAKYTGGN